MFGLGPATKIYIAVEGVDMRKGFDGLYGLVRAIVWARIRKRELQHPMGSDCDQLQWPERPGGNADHETTLPSPRLLDRAGTTGLNSSS